MTSLPAEPSRFGRYLVTGRLGEGAMGAVFAARDEVLGRDVAIKTIHAPGGRERFRNEARAVAQLAHPNVVRMFDVGEHDDVPYLVMELARGGSLKARLVAGPLTASEVRTLGIQVAHALAAAHERGVIHRDIKPANILATALDTWKLADFGIAHVPDHPLTSAGELLGSPAYAAPEWLHHAAAPGPASDVYGLCCVLYEALVGRVLHGDGSVATRLAHDVDHERLAGELAALAPFGEAIARGLAREPSRRPSAVELAALLASDRAAHPVLPPAAADATVYVPDTPPRDRAAGDPQRRVVAWAVIGLLAIVVIAIIASSLSRGSGAAGVTGDAPEALETPRSGGPRSDHVTPPREEQSRAAAGDEHRYSGGNDEHWTEEPESLGPPPRGRGRGAKKPKKHRRRGH
jgi:eukaryotic-like serine/threonine-protein kinase